MQYANDYLQEILRKYQVNANDAQVAAFSLYSVIEEWGAEYLNRVEFSGSLLKGTAISNGTNADILISVAPDIPCTLAQMYHRLIQILKRMGYRLVINGVSIGIWVDQFLIDLIPARSQSLVGNDHKVYLKKTGRSAHTNLQKHIDHVKKSDCIQEIKLIKIWSTLHQLDVSSFFLEMMVIEALKNSKTNDLSHNFLTIINFFNRHLHYCECYDPANPENKISDDVTYAEKKALALQARISYMQKHWGYIIW